MAVAQLQNGVLIWNLTSPVGVRQPNRIDDVELVRFGYVMARVAPDANNFPPAMLSAMAEMRRTGGFDSDLDTVIRDHQTHKKTPVDGKVSIMHDLSHNKGRFDGVHSFILLNLNNFMRDFEPYPRIDLHPDSGFEISKVAARLRSR